MKEYILTVKVKTNAEASGEDVAKILNTLINAGLSDAQSTIEEGEGDLDAAALATDLHIEAPVLAKTPRVLVIVDGGVADYVSDKDVDVEIFDWDNYNADPVATSPMPAHFADLAEHVRVPVEGGAA